MKCVGKSEYVGGFIMKTIRERDFTIYPRQFKTYKWFKPLLIGVLFIVFFFLFASLVYLVTSLVFHTTVTTTGYDNLNYYSAAGAFFNGAMGAIYIPSLLFAALIVKDRPISSYFSSMGGWRWKTFLKTFVAGFVIFGIPTIIKFLLSGKTGDIQFTKGGFIFLILFMPLSCIAEELMFRGFIMQTVSSWFRMPVMGMIVQTIVFAAAHPYNLTGVIYIAASAVIYGIICICSRGIEASSALHILNNLIELIMGGLGFGILTAEQTLSSTVIIIVLKLLFLVFIVYADQKLHWFDEVQYDDIESYNANSSYQ